MLSTEGQAAVEVMKKAKAARLKRTFEEMRAYNKTLNSDKLPSDAVVEHLTIRDVHVEKISLPESEEDSVLFYIHGGGFVNGWASNCYWVAPQIARRTNMTVYALDYRLAPEFLYPTAFMDCVNVWKALVMRMGVNPSKSAFIGTSAGGSLVLSTGLWCRDHGIPLPGLMVVNSPWVGEGIEPSEEEIEQDVILNYSTKKSIYLSTADTDDPCAYPIIGDYYGFPRTLIYAAKKEILRKHSELLDRKFTEQGIDHLYKEDPELWHAFLNKDIPENIPYVNEIAKEINRVKNR